MQTAIQQLHCADARDDRESERRDRENDPGREANEPPQSKALKEADDQSVGDQMRKTSAEGQVTLRSGNRDRDAICGDPPREPFASP
jgi:hypothetical protein